MAGKLEAKETWGRFKAASTTARKTHLYLNFHDYGNELTNKKEVGI